MKSLLLEEIIDIGAVSPQKVEGHGVIVLHGLTHVDDPNFSLVVKHVVLTEIAMH